MLIAGQKGLIQHEEVGKKQPILWASGVSDNFCKAVAMRSFISFCREDVDHELPPNHVYPQVFLLKSPGAPKSLDSPEEKRGREKDKEVAGVPASISSQEGGLFS